MLLHCESTARPSSVRLFTTMDAIRSSGLLSNNVTQAYHESQEELDRKVYWKPVAEPRIAPGSMFHKALSDSLTHGITGMHLSPFYLRPI